MNEALPLLVLGGSDRRAHALPAGVQAQALRGFKGTLPLPGGRTLAGELIARLRASGRFEPALVGPRRVYDAAAIGCEVIDCEGDLGTTLRAGLRSLLRGRSPSAPLAVIACDVLPGAGEIDGLLAREYDPVRECQFWGQLIEAAPAEMGASHWKPGYGLLDPPRGGTHNYYPGHLVIVRPGALQLPVTLHLLRLAYRYRNRPLLWRIPGMLARGASALAWQDLCNLARLRPSALALGIPWYCLHAYTRYRRGRLSVAELERVCARLLLRRRFRTLERPVVFARCPVLSLAKDIDTRAELEEAAATCARGDP